MNKLFTDEAWDDYTFWFNTDKKILKKINASGVGVVLVSHDLNIVLNYATKIAYVSKNLHIHKTHEDTAKREFIEHLAKSHSHFCDVEIALGECECKIKSNVFKLKR